MGETRGEALTRELLKDLIHYRSRTNDATESNPNPIQRMVREISDEMKEQLDIHEPDKLKYLLGNPLALETLFHYVYQEVVTDEQYVFATMAVFTYIAEMCKDVSEDCHSLILDNVIVVLKSSLKGQHVMLLIVRLYDRARMKTTVKKIMLCTLCFGVLGLIWWRTS